MQFVALTTKTHTIMLILKRLRDGKKKFISVKLLSLLFLLLGLYTCTPARYLVPKEDTIVEFTILQLNDVYEIAPLEGGKAGGLARVATVRKELMRENPNVITIMAGDFLSPSFVGTLKFEDENGVLEKIAGQQMVETLNAMGLDYATFGNHEFDLSDVDLLEKRLAQSKFKYTVCNALKLQGDRKIPFQQGTAEVPEYLVQTITNKQGASFRLGLLGVVLPFAQQDYLHYNDVTTSFRETYAKLKDVSDLQIAITHLNLDEDLQLAADVPGLPLFVGGHEHANLTRYVGNTLIAKADANAKTVYIHRIKYDTRSELTEINSELRVINDRIPDDPATKLIVDKWQEKAFRVMIDLGYSPDQLVMNLSEPLVCKESLIRTSQTNYGRLTMDAIASALPGADVYFINSGSMRLDDNLSGAVTEYDVLRTYPFGGDLVRIQLPGASLREVLQIGTVTNFGEGGYFQLKGAELQSSQVLIAGKPIDDQKTYTAVLPSFVAKGREANLSMLAAYYDGTPPPAILSINGREVKNDLRDIVIDYMKVLGEY